MSSLEDNGHFASSPQLQSAQQPADQIYAENEDLDLSSDHLSDAPSDRKPTSQESSQSDSSAGNDPPAKQSIAEDEHHDFLDENSQDSASVPSRPNKFRGPPSTWRNWTAAERELAASLDQLQAKDLSVHLYNSFKLKQRSAARNKNQRAQVSDDLEEVDRELNWVPPKVWTAWPLSPDIIPREDDGKRWEEDAILTVPYHSSSKRPGQHLQEMLTTQVLRKAKERFHDRQWESSPQSGATSTPKRQQSHGRRKNTNGTFGAKEADEVPDQKPVFMADDQRASEILKPTVQHIMTKLDDLLLGLHHARSAYLAAEDSGSESQSQTGERSTSRGRPQKRKQEAPKVDEDAEASHGTPNHPRSDSDDRRLSRKTTGSKGSMQYGRSSSRRSRTQNFRVRKGRLGLRDWSDVLGIASMTGWRHDVVGSAAARCATLLGEGIKFRTLDEGQEVREEHLYLPDVSPPLSAENSQRSTWRAREGSSNRFGGGKVGAVHVDGFLKPIKGMKSWIYNNNKQSKRRQPSRKTRGSN